uniref:Uncharacterized protein n=1 Tax=Arundo donax TaxID=35708 RepID=A0A0A9AV22_ARUDO
MLLLIDAFTLNFYFLNFWLKKCACCYLIHCYFLLCPAAVFLSLEIL